MEGWIKLHRDIREHWLWEDKPFDRRSAWIDLILSANHKDNKLVLGNEILVIERGSFITSEVKLMERWGWSKSKVRSFLNLLQNDKMIVRKTDHKKTTLTICNYNVWQDGETTEEPQKDRKKTAKEPQKDTNKNVKNVKNVKKEEEISIDDFFETIWTMYPKKSRKAAVKPKQKKILYEIGIEKMTKAIENYKKAKDGADMQYWHAGYRFFNEVYVDYLEENYVPVKRNTKATQQHQNFEQRQYDDVDFDKFYDN